MAILAMVLGILGGLCAVVGIITAVDVVPFLAELPADFNAMFWMVLAAILLLGCIASLLSHSEYE
ncbi:hypothetical protein ACFLYQ_02840 [Chloroflexota bacterium]